MRGFDTKFIEELKNKNDIVDVISRYVTLEQRGGSYWGKCPFHHEKTPSFSVNPAGQFFYCFGCHKSGDVISFIMGIENIDFSDAVKFLADRVGLILPEITVDDEQIKAQKQKKERVLELLKDTALFYVNNLRSEKADKYIDYILKRKISKETSLKFGLGASLDFNSLPEYLKSKGYTYQEMLESGAVDVKDGRYYDSLGGRFIIPMINQFNQVVAFVGRNLEKTDFAKYKNTKETIVFSKGNTLFNINNLKKIKNEKGIDSVIIVEGHIDVISLVQAGFNNVVASMGTALTKDQARILKRYADKIYISYDGDFAGHKASIRGLEILKEEGLEVKVVSLPDGKDPDDVIKDGGYSAYEKLLAEAKPLIDFKLEILKNTFDINAVDGKRKYIREAVRVIKESSSPAEQEDLLKTVRDNTGVSFETLKRELFSVDTDKKEQTVLHEEQIIEKTGDKYVSASRYVLYSYLFNKPYSEETDIDTIEFFIDVHKAFQTYISSRKKEGLAVRFSDLYDLFPENQEELSLIAGMETEENKMFDQAIYFADCIKTLKIFSINKQIAKLTEDYKVVSDNEQRKTLAENISELLKEKNTLL